MGDGKVFNPALLAFVITVALPSKMVACERTDAASLEEAVDLATSIGLKVVHQQIVWLSKITPATLVGKGTVATIKTLISHHGVTVVIIDGALTPVQQRNLEVAWNVKVIDRTGLILEIFGQRARTAEGRLQVELARLSYQRSRLVRTWTHLERQRGGFGFTGGPGETQLELDRRLIDERIVKIKQELEQIKKTRALHRQSRKRIPYPVIALVGYTNAGKSTLFNALTKAAVLAEHRLFATLDPTMRLLKLPSGREVVLSDTVGFISQLPTTLVAAFRATLEEVTSADLIVHVHNAAHPDRAQQAKDVEKVLSDLGLQELVAQEKLVEVYNKIDLLAAANRQLLEGQLSQKPVAISALTRENLFALLTLCDQRLSAGSKKLTVTLNAQQGNLLAWCYRHGGIVSRKDREDSIELTLQLNLEEWQQFWQLYQTGK